MSPNQKMASTLLLFFNIHRIILFSVIDDILCNCNYFQVMFHELSFFIANQILLFVLIVLIL